MDDRESVIAALKERLEEAERALAAAGPLEGKDADDVQHRLERLASQVQDLTEPPSMAEVRRALGTHPIRGDAAKGILSDALPPDGEG